MVAAGGSALWTCQRDGEVTLRTGESGMAAETPLTVNQMFAASVERFPDLMALSWKEGEQRQSLTWRGYYQSCRTAARAFLKVRPRPPGPRTHTLIPGGARGGGGGQKQRLSSWT